MHSVYNIMKWYFPDKNEIIPLLKNATKVVLHKVVYCSKQVFTCFVFFTGSVIEETSSSDSTEAANKRKESIKSSLEKDPPSIAVKGKIGI